MQRPGGAAAVFRIRFTQADGFVLQFARELRALERILTEKRFQLRILHGFRRLAKAFLPIFERFDQVVDRRDNLFLLTHSKINTDAGRGEGGYFFPKNLRRSPAALSFLMNNKVKGKDLTKEPPRSPRVRIGGYAI